MTKHVGTPRTDAALIYVGGYHYVAPDFARTLERALSERDRDLKECVELLEALHLSATLEQFWQLQGDAVVLLARLKERT